MRHQRCSRSAGVAVILAITACGSSGGSHRPATAIGLSSTVRYADCMRTNGVPNFPDPSDGGLAVPPGLNPASPAFQTAQHACQSLMPGPVARAPATAQQKETLLSLSRCMRGHGVSSFPDPVESRPADPAGLVMAFGRPGAYIVIADALNPQSPAFVQAADACHLPGSSGGGPKRG
jgi:hypothetical protein